MEQTPSQVITTMPDGSIYIHPTCSQHADVHLTGDPYADMECPVCACED